MSIKNSTAPGQSSWFSTVFGVDTRSLAAMRIGLGLILLLNLWLAASDVTAFFTDEGMLPRADRLQLNLDENYTVPPYMVSVHMLSGSKWFQLTLFGIASLFAVCVLVGYRTQWSLFASWLLLVGMQARNPLILQGGDDILKLLTFWSIFLPLGAKWSVDRRLTQTAVPPWVVSLPSAALLMQLGCVYVFSAMLKSHPVWRTEFSATYFAFALGHFTRPFGFWLLNYPRFLQVMTVGALVLEFCGPIALLYPARRSWLRIAIVASFWALHLGIMSTLSLGLFPATCLVYWLAVLPSGFWDWSGWQRLSAAMAGGAAVMEATLRFVFGVADRPKWLWAKPTPACERQSVAGNVLVFLLLMYVLLLNVTQLQTSPFGMNPGPVRVLGEAAQMSQFWALFGPRPPDSAGWFNVRGTLADGSYVNLMHPEEPSFETAPPLVSATYPSQHWRKTMMVLFERDCPTHTRCTGEFMRRRWNATHGPEQQLVAAEIRWINKQVVVPGGDSQPASDYTTTVLWHWEQPGPSAIGAETGLTLNAR